MGQAIEQPGGNPFAEFGMSISSDASAGVVFVPGALDLITAPRLELLLDHLRDDGHRQITVDLSQLTFLGAADLSVGIRAAHALRVSVDGCCSPGPTPGPPHPDPHRPGHQPAHTNDHRQLLRSPTVPPGCC
jgi:hypothetical protein